jgi:hypothetical protein
MRVRIRLSELCNWRRAGLADRVRGSSTGEDARRNPPPVRMAWRITPTSARARDPLANPPYALERTQRDAPERTAPRSR